MTAVVVVAVVVVAHGEGCEERGVKGGLSIARLFDVITEATWRALPPWEGVRVWGICTRGV